MFGTELVSLVLAIPTFQRGGVGRAGSRGGDLSRATRTRQETGRAADRASEWRALMNSTSANSTREKIGRSAGYLLGVLVFFPIFVGTIFALVGMIWFTSDDAMTGGLVAA